jgi:hypothetical protein
MYLKKYHTVRIFLKSKRKIVERGKIGPTTHEYKIGPTTHKYMIGPTTHKYKIGPTTHKYKIADCVVKLVLWTHISLLYMCYYYYMSGKRVFRNTTMFK